MAKKNVLTPQVRAEAESMIEAGEDPKEIQRYLAEHGSKNPSAHLYAIKNGMKKKAQQKDELAGFVPMDLKKKKPEKVTFNGKEFEKMEKEAEDKFKKAETAAEKIVKGLQNIAQQCKLPEPSFKIREAEGVCGIWRNDGNGWISYLKGDNWTKMRVEDWLAMTAELPNVLKLFGIEEAGA